jgi:hypothetical protein
MSQESKENTPFENRSREVLEESTARLDGRTLSRLTQARHAALENARRPARLGFRFLVPAGATAAAVLAVVMWMGRPGHDPQVPVASNTIEDLELLADADAPDFVEDGEDLEFYEWAAGEVES